MMPLIINVMSYFMSRELYLAAATGNKELVLQLLNNGKCEIDGLYPYEKHKDFRLTALAIALRNEHFEVAQVLIAYGASIYQQIDHVPGIDILLPINILINDNLPLDISKTMLHKLESLFIYLHHECPGILLFKKIYGKELVSHRVKEYFLMEAMLRNDKPVLLNILMMQYKPLITATSLQLYLKGTQLDDDSLIKLDWSIAFLEQQHCISCDTAKALRQMLNTEYQKQQAPLEPKVQEAALSSKIDALTAEVQQLKNLQLEHMKLLQQLLQPQPAQGNYLSWFKPGKM